MSSHSDKLTIGLMTKYWDRGKVKTRLGKSIGMENARSLHQLFVSYLCASLSHVSARRVLCVAPDHRLPAMESALKSWGLNDKWELLAQGTGTLGERMERWFIHSLGDESSQAILIGADCPRLDADQIQRASDLLRARDVVLGPAADGGYYLIGLRGAWEPNESRFKSLFREVPWSTASVLHLTRDRLSAARLSFAELETHEDVDTADELMNLCKSLERDSARHSKLKVGIDQILARPSLSDPPSTDLQ